MSKCSYSVLTVKIKVIFLISSISFLLLLMSKVVCPNQTPQMSTWTDTVVLENVINIG